MPWKIQGDLNGTDGTFIYTLHLHMMQNIKAENSYENSKNEGNNNCRK